MTVPRDDSRLLLGLLDVGEVALRDFTGLVRTLDDADWERPTDLPGWSVHDVVSHTAHLESVIAGGPEESLSVPDDLSHVTSLMSTYTEQGVIARRDRSREELLAEIEGSAARRFAATRAAPPTDGRGDPPCTPGGIGWSWRTLLTNRPVDLFVHEHDVRRAVERPRPVEGPVAAHVLGVFGRGLGYVVGKRAGAAPGRTVAVELTDRPERWVVAVGQDGRGAPADPEVEPDATVRLSAESFLVLSAGRRTPDTREVHLSGDRDLGGRVVAALRVTP